MIAWVVAGFVTTFVGRRRAVFLRLPLLFPPLKKGGRGDLLLSRRTANPPAQPGSSAAGLR
ncbi:hypothetical protein AB4084_19180, partial [Lysobacter sp. 2RAB21]